MKKIYLASPHMMGNEEKYVKEAFLTNWIAPLGPFVNRLEDDFKKYFDLSGACVLSSGTAALHLALKLLDVKENDIVFCSSLTFCASANPIVYEGAKPVFIDSESDTYNMSPLALKKAFLKYPNPKAVIIVSLYGMPAKYDELMEICEEHGVAVIEDSAESLGSIYKGRKVGTFGDYSIISFNGNKIITTSGGGMLLTHDASKARDALKLATQARDDALWYQHSMIGYNYRMSNVCAAIGCGQFEFLDKKIRLKREIFDRYVEGFKDISQIEMLVEPDGFFSTHWLSIMRLKNTDVCVSDVIDALGCQNIESRYIWKPLHLQPVFSDCDFFSDGDSVVCEDLFNNGVCLPSDTNMSLLDQEKIILIIRNLFDR
ncbi:MAG: DegT/DnrJ/EryC1/StrS family aminotransferase [Bacilli bacterium]|nr:DegT/DnrJ/EryC1/StrS family aminotransferase [Bacilli bacterium]